MDTPHIHIQALELSKPKIEDSSLLKVVEQENENFFLLEKTLEMLVSMEDFELKKLKNLILKIGNDEDSKSVNDEGNRYNSFDSNRYNSHGQNQSISSHGKLKLIINALIKTDKNLDEIVISLLDIDAWRLVMMLLDCVLENVSDTTILVPFFTRILQAKFNSPQIHQNIHHSAQLKITSWIAMSQDPTLVSLLEIPLLTSPPSVNNHVQSFILQVYLNMLESEKLDACRTIQLLSARLSYIWVWENSLDWTSIKILNLLADKFQQIDNILLFRGLYLILCTILLDYPSLDLFILLEKILARLENDAVVLFAYLPVLSALALPTASPKTIPPFMSKADSILKQLETMKPTRKEIPVDASLAFNPIYAIFLHTCSFTPCEDFTLFQVIPALESLKFGFDLFFSNQHGMAALLGLHSFLTKCRISDVLKFLYTFIFLSNHGKYTNTLLTKSIPELSLVNDAYVSSACLKISKTLLNPEEHTSHLEKVGLESIISLWKVQKRVFPEIKNYIAGWVNRFKRSQGAGRQKPPEVIKRENDLEIAVTKAIFEFCKYDPSNCGTELIPIIVSLLKISGNVDFGVTRDPSEEATGHLLSAFIQCVRGGVTTTRTAWKVMMKSYYEKLNDSSYPVIYAKLCEFFSIVPLDSDDDESDAEVEFRGEILNKHLVPLLDHPDEMVRSEALIALKAFKFEEVEHIIPRPVEFVAKVLSKELPLNAACDFLVTRIEEECLNMSRPVFKGLSIEPGAKGAAKVSSKPDSTKLDGIVVGLNNISSQLLSDWKARHANRSGIACAFLLYPSIESKESLEEAIGLVMKDVSTAFGSCLVPIDLREAWLSYCTFFINYLYQEIESSKFDAEEKERLLKVNVHEVVTKHLQMVDSTIPSTANLGVIICSSLLLAAYQLHFFPFGETISFVISKYLAVMEAPSTPKEVLNSLAFSLADLLDLADTAASDAIISLIWSQSAQSIDSFALGFANSKILYRTLSFSTPLQSAKATSEFLGRYWEDNEGWKSLGAAIGFSLILASPLVQVSNDVNLERIIQHSFENITNSSRSDASSWILSCGWKYGPFSVQNVEVQIRKAFDMFKGSSMDLEHLCLAQIRIRVLESSSKALMNNVFQDIKSGKNSQQITSAFASLRILVNRDYSFDVSNLKQIVGVEELNAILDVCKQELLYSKSPATVRSSGWVMGLTLLSIYNFANGTLNSFVKSHSGYDPSDYRRLNPESSFLKAAFESLQKETDIISSLFDIFARVGCILPPVDWKPLIPKFKSCHEMKLVGFASKQAGLKGSQTLLAYYMENIPLGNSEFLLSEYGIPKLLQLGGIGGETACISLVSFFKDFLASKAEPTTKLNVLNICGKELSGAKSEAAEQFRGFLVDYVLNGTLDLECEYDFRLVSSCLAVIEDSEALQEKVQRETQSDSMFNLWCLGNLCQFKESLLNEFLRRLWNTSKNSSEYKKSIFILGNVLSKRLQCGDDPAKLMMKVFDLLILSKDCSEAWIQFVYLHWIAPSVYTIFASRQCFIVGSDLDWELIKSSSSLILMRQTNKTLMDRITSCAAFSKELEWIISN